VFEGNEIALFNQTHFFVKKTEMGETDRRNLKEKKQQEEVL